MSETNNNQINSDEADSKDNLDLGNGDPGAENIHETDALNQLGDAPLGDVGLEDIATKERLEEEAQDEREWRRQPSDLISPGDPNAGDVGISGGMAVGDIDIMELEGEDFEGEEVS